MTSTRIRYRFFLLLLSLSSLQLQGDDDECKELQKEINILKTCHSPYIVAYKGSFMKDGKIWIVMEYCGVGSISDLMAICDTTLTEAQIAAVMKQSIEGLRYLHANKKIHRDIKSGNILLTHAGECKLADFGVSAELSSTLAKRVTMIGTPYFMAPEVLESSKYDAKADIWSIAITAYELAVGQPPLADIHPMRAIFLIPTGPAPTLPNPENYSPEFNDFLRVCLQKDPSKRPSADELLKHPFLQSVKEKAVILELLDDCLKAIEDYRDMEAKEQQENNQHLPGAGPAVGGGGADGGDESGTMVNRGGNGGANNQSGTMIGPSDRTWSGPEDGTVVIKASQLASFAGGAANNNNNNNNNSNAVNASGTMVVTGGSAGGVGDSGTVLVSSGAGARNDDHFGTIKVQRQEHKKGPVAGAGASASSSSSSASASNNSGTVVVSGGPRRQSVDSSAGVVGASGAVGSGTPLNFARSNQLLATLSNKSSVADIQAAVSQLNTFFVADQQALAAFYTEKQLKLDALLKERK